MSRKMLMNINNQFDDRGIIVTKRLIPRGEKFPPHWHDYIELEIILSGQAKQIYNGDVCMLRRGSMYLLSYCDYHSFSAVSDVTLINICFRENILNKSLAQHINLKPNRLICSLNERAAQDVISKAKALSDELLNRRIFSDIAASGILSEMIVYLIRNSPENASAAVPQIIQRAAVYINTNFREHISLSALARQLSVSANYLGCLFKKHLGTSFNEYLNNIRLRYACNLLMTSELSVKEIAFASGYSSVEYFSYIFKKTMSLSPGAYHENMR